MSANLFDKLCGRLKEKTYNVDGISIKFRVLSQNDLDEVMRTVSGLVSSDDYVGKLSLIKVPTLARAIVEIDNRAIDSYPEIVDSLRERRDAYPVEPASISLRICLEKFLGKLPSSRVEVLYQAYEELKAEDDKETESLKKNWVQIPQEHFGK